MVLTRFTGQESAIAYQRKLESLGIKVYRHYSIPSYPSNVPLIISDEGFGKNDYIETSRSLIVVTAPGPVQERWQFVFLSFIKSISMG